MEESPFRILVVDDEELVLDSVVMAMERLHYQVDAAPDVKTAMSHLEDNTYHLVISDIRLPEDKYGGMAILRKVKENSPETDVLMMTGFGTIENAVEAIRMGAFDYIEKGSGLLIPTLELRVEKVIENQERRREFSHLQEQNRDLRSELDTRYGFQSIIGRSRKTTELFDQLRLVAGSKATVFIQGASGTGKELVARALHYNSPRRDKPFIKINCAAMPEGLIESELFGHEKGAFTGAIKTTKGKFELADGGTLLLDEISEMNSLLQAKLLRVLQEREFEKIGDNRTIHIDVRIIATTNRDIQEYIRDGKFREDLFFRLNVIPIILAPLSDKREDIPLLVEYFIGKFAQEHNREIDGISEAAMNHLQNQEWPGNVRELENSVERSIVLCEERTLQLKHFSPDSAPAGVQSSTIGFSERSAEVISIAEMEKRMILRALEQFDNNRTRAAEALGISIRTLRNKLREYREAGMDIP
ncbi:MAG: sigma-54-dependent Fis family transcriptional regulator [candidate division Zixibacteria bacterium]|nr:sigma-54-dependent Fis family transcriptional regulator [Candidatus Tariuqbacter arcticus]